MTVMFLLYILAPFVMFIRRPKPQHQLRTQRRVGDITENFYHHAVEGITL